MEKIIFTHQDTGEEVEFFILEETRVGGTGYILVTDSTESEAECFIFRNEGETEEDAIYVPVEDETELVAVGKVFAELMEDVFLEM